jgi:hypothetical protein
VPEHPDRAIRVTINLKVSPERDKEEGLASFEKFGMAL